jgi:hypothetical protein
MSEQLKPGQISDQQKAFFKGHCDESKGRLDSSQYKNSAQELNAYFKGRLASLGTKFDI